MFGRRSRSLDVLLRDPNFPYHVGRLMGAAEMTGHWLATRQDEEAQYMGRQLAAVVGWFFEEEPERTGSAGGRNVLPPPSTP